MTQQGMSLIEFEHDCIDFEKNRMYPPTYRKEPAMLKLTLDHVAAISRAEGAMYPDIKSNMSPFHRSQVEYDLQRLAQVKKFVLAKIYEPGLPINTQSVEVPKNYGDARSRKPNR